MSISADPDQLRPMLIRMNGNIKRVAREIDADSEELRALVMNTPLLRRALDEVIARGVDESVTALFEMLEDDHAAVQMAAAKEFLKSRAGQRRGFHHNKDLELKASKGALTLTWLPQDKPEAPMIEGTVAGKDD